MENKKDKALTKEKCQIAWNTIKDLNDYPIQCTTNETQDKFQVIPFVELFCDEITLIDNLIKEHFDNPPLKFEELKDGMWVWDNSVYEKNYTLIKRKFMCSDDYVVAMKQDEGECEDGDDYLGRVFEDNRFYRREVIE